MAKFLGYSRINARAAVIDTVNKSLAYLGVAFGLAEITSLYDGRSQNPIALFLGDPFIAYKTSGGFINIDRYIGGVWTNMNIRTPVGAGVIQPLGLELLNDTLLMVYSQTGGIGQGLYAARSVDGVVWTSNGVLTAPLGVTGTTIRWKRAVFAATEAGIMVSTPFDAPFVLPPDIGSDGGLASTLTVAGSFCYWEGDLYFIKPDGGAGAQLYKLDPAWNSTTPTTPPAWTNQTATGFLPLLSGTLTIAPDGGRYCLFENKASELVVVQTGSLGTVLLKTTKATFPVFTDISDQLADGVAILPNTRFSLYEDDRRRTNRLQSLTMTRTGSVDTTVFNWDGANVMTEVDVFTGVLLLPPHDQQADLRTFMDIQPAINITGVTQPFPGRVEVNYVLRDTLSRLMDVSVEYSVAKDDWFPITEGDGSDGLEQLISSPAGTSHLFVGDIWVDLNGSYDDLNIRVVPRIAG